MYNDMIIIEVKFEDIPRHNVNNITVFLNY